MTKHTKTVMKVQRPLSSNVENPLCLFYNQDRSILFEYPMTDDLRVLFGPYHKVYCVVTLIPDPVVEGGFSVEIGNLVDYQPW